MRFRPVALVALMSLATALPCRAGVVRGVVLESKSGRPLPGARAYTYLPGQANAVSSQAMSDSMGVFWLTNVPAGVITLRVQAAWHEAWTGTVTMGGARDTAKVEAQLVRVPIPGSASGVITFEAGTKPGRHAHVGVKGTEVEATADDSGQYIMYGVPVGPRTLDVVALGYDMIHVPILVEEGRNSVVSIDLGHTILGGGSSAKPGPEVSLADSAAYVRFMVADTAQVQGRMPATPRHVKVEILSGDRIVRKLMDWTTVPGPYSVVWDGRDNSGKLVAAGTYRYRTSIDSDPPIEGDIVKK
jgi:translation initiation factor IF-1